MGSHFSKFYPNFALYVSELNDMIVECRNAYKVRTDYKPNWINKKLGKKIEVKLPARFYAIFD